MTDKIEINYRGLGPLLAMRYLVSIAIYCIIGLGIDYWLFVPDGGTTAWTMITTYLVMVFWPAVLIWQFLVIMFWLTIIVGVIIFIVWFWQEKVN